VDNVFYFRCEDQPLAEENDRNAMTQSYEFVLAGTEPLIIVDVSPVEGTVIKESTSVVPVFLEVETDNGYNFGDSWCSYSETGVSGDWIQMFETGETNEHSQRLDLVEGDYTYYFECTDLGGNADRTNTTFSIEVDNDEPQVIRVYNVENQLKILTDEKSNCAYSTNTDRECRFILEEAIEMTLLNSTVHYADWETDKNYYIKCEDAYGNQPLPEECSIILRPFDFPELAE
jgi:hypothetical protein